MPSDPNQLWGSDPVQAFVRLRDRVCDALHFVVEVHRRALAAPEGENLANVRPELHEALGTTVAEAQALWCHTPISCYLDRPEGPVYLDPHESPTVARASGSCHHDLALGLAERLLLRIKQSLPAKDYVRDMRFFAAAGDHVAERLNTLVSFVRCECQQGIARWKAEAIPGRLASNFSQGRTDQAGLPKRGGGKRPLEESDPVKFQVYERIRREHHAGEEYADIVKRLKADRDFTEQVKAVGLKLNTNLVKNALAFFNQRKRDQARKKQETDQG